MPIVLYYAVFRLFSFESSTIYILYNNNNIYNIFMFDLLIFLLKKLKEYNMNTSCITFFFKYIYV